MPLPVHHAIAEFDQAPRRPTRAVGALRNFAMEESRRSFLRMVSHELRTPLNAIIGFSEIISRELYGPVSDPRYREHAELVHQSGLQLLKLVNDVLDIARMEAGAMDLDIRPEEPLAALEEILKSVIEEARARGARLQISASAQTPRVMADFRGLRTIFQNLIQNALAHSPQGGMVDISARGDGEHVIFEITDHGDGVSPEDLALILNPFEQTEHALVRRSEGAGLGLAVVSLLCQSMKGSLNLRSNPGEGLTAVVRLPAADKLKSV